MSNNIEIKNLFSYNRFSQNEFKFLLVILYLPLGLVLFLLRSILLVCLVILSQIPSDSPVYQKVVNKLACLCFGVTITVENPKKKENVEAYISNNLSVFDKLALYTATGAVSVNTKKSPLGMLSGLGCYNFSASDVDTLKKNIIDFISGKKTPLCFTPEERLTNGRALLKFKPQMFELVSKVQPVCISIERSFLDISLTTLGSTYLNDVFYFMFTPLTNYKLKFLSSLERKSLSVEEFVEIVRQNLATGLKVELTDYTVNDVIEWEKRKIAEEQMQNRMAQTRMNNTVGRNINSELQRMTVQVKEVLPHVPYNTIYSDLCNTRSVDNTITNILEGRLRFTPEPITSSVTHVSLSQPSTSKIDCSSSSSSSSGVSQTQFNTAASSFAKSATERSRSFQERKEQLIAAARRRYIEKHNLDIPF